MGDNGPVCISAQHHGLPDGGSRRGGRRRRDARKGLMRVPVRTSSPSAKKYTKWPARTGRQRTRSPRASESGGDPSSRPSGIPGRRCCARRHRPKRGHAGMAWNFNGVPLCLCQAIADHSRNSPRRLSAPPESLPPIAPRHSGSVFTRRRQRPAGGRCRSASRPRGDLILGTAAPAPVSSGSCDLGWRAELNALWRSPRWHHPVLVAVSRSDILREDPVDAVARSACTAVGVHHHLDGVSGSKSGDGLDSRGSPVTG